MTVEELIKKLQEVKNKKKKVTFLYSEPYDDDAEEYETQIFSVEEKKKTVMFEGF